MKPETSLRPRLPRMAWWLVAAVALLGVVWLVAPQQLPVSLYKLSLVSLAGVLGYWLDRGLFPYARPDALLHRALNPPCADCTGEEDAEPRPDGAAVLSLGCSMAPELHLAGMAMLRRAVVVAATMLAMGLGA